MAVLIFFPINNRWNAVKKQSRVVECVHVGRLDADTGIVNLGKTYLTKYPELEGKTMFYEDNELVQRSTNEIESIKLEVESFSD